jgi:nicotinate-nucleotide adenylyltransferase
MKIGILGGSFNPIHNGHLAMAEAARKAHGLDLVIFIPAGRPPHKRADLATPGERLEMVRKAIEGREGLLVSDIEVSRPGTTYTVDTLEELRRRYPGDELFFIIGADSVPELKGWKSPARILELARIITVNRPGSKAHFRPEDFPQAPREALARLESDRISMPPCPQESRRIRERVRSGKPIDRDVPPEVAAYILAKGLYRDLP